MKRHNSKRPLPHLATLIFDTPLLVHPKKAEIILRALGERIGIRADDWEDYGEPMAESEDSKECCVEDGIACIPIYGTLVKRSMGMDARSGMTSYECLQEQIEDACTDPNVKGILLDIDSPGGEVSGMFELADFIYNEVRGSVPIYAVANDSAFSAAYALASCADRLFVSRTGGVGSIGCYMLHVDQSGYDKQMGVKYTYIHAGAHKVDGNPHEPLSNTAEAEIQSRVDRIRDMFVSLVARNRSVSADALLATEAGCFYAEQAIPLLADQVGSKEDAMAALRAAVGLPEDDQEDDGPDAPEMPEQMPMAAESPIKLVINAERLESPTIAGSRLTHTQEFLLEQLPKLGISMAQRGAKAASIGVHDPNGRFQELFIRSAPIIASGSDLISCCVAPYHALSVDLGGFREEYAPGCFRESLASGDDLLVLFNHNRDYVLGRLSAGTARFFDTPEGLCFESDPPETQWASDLLVSMKRGDITQGSASFWIEKARWETRSGEKIRVIERARLLECSVTAFAAYQTSHSAVQQKQIPAASTNFPQQHELLGARLRLLAL